MFCFVFIQVPNKSSAAPKMLSVPPPPMILNESANSVDFDSSMQDDDASLSESKENKKPKISFLKGTCFICMPLFKVFEHKGET